MMKIMHYLEVKSRDIDQLLRDMQKKLGKLDTRIESIDCVLKKMVDQSGVVLWPTTDNIKILLEKLEKNRKVQVNKEKEEQGPNKQTRANMKKIEV